MRYVMGPGGLRGLGDTAACSDPGIMAGLTEWGSPTGAIDAIGNVFGTSGAMTCMPMYTIGMVAVPIVGIILLLNLLPSGGKGRRRR